MNTSLLRLTRRDSRGIRHWIIPGFGNGARAVPAALSFRNWGIAVHWPAVDDKGEHIKGVDLARHRDLAKRELREMINSVDKK